MADFARRRKVALHVRRTAGVVEIFLMARDTCRLRQIEIVAGVAPSVAARARRHRVRAGQREAGLGVIELRRRPAHDRVARVTRLRESQLHMVGVVRLLKVAHVASHAGRYTEAVVVICVAVSASTRRYGVATDEQESRRRVVELRIQPVVGGVAGLERGGEFPRHVIRIAHGLKLLLVAAETGRGHGVVLAQRSVLVTVVAGGGGVRAREREPVHVLIDLGNRDLPPADGMAVLAGGSHAALVEVGMAIDTLVADIGEHHFGMATGTVNAFVHAAQWEARLAVIKLGHGTDRFPAIYGVAVLAGKVQIAVGAARVRRRLCLGDSEGRRQQEPPDHPFRYQPWQHDAPAPLFRIPTRKPVRRAFANCDAIEYPRRVAVGLTSTQVTAVNVQEDNAHPVQKPVPGPLVRSGETKRKFFGEMRRNYCSEKWTTRTKIWPSSPLPLARTIHDEPGENRRRARLPE